MFPLEPILSAYSEAKPTFLSLKEKEKGFNINQYYKIKESYKNEWDSFVYYIQNIKGETISVTSKTCVLRK